MSSLRSQLFRLLAVAKSALLVMAVLAVMPTGSAFASDANGVITVDSAGDVGRFTSIAIGNDGFPVISYYDITGNALNVAHCDDVACTSSTITPVAAVGGPITSVVSSSIAIGSDGFPVISYFDWANQDLRVAHCENVACTSSTVTPIDSDTGGEVGVYNSIAIGIDGLAVFSYSDSATGELKVGHCSNVACTSATIESVDTDSATFNAIAIGSEGFPVIAYFNDAVNRIKVARCNDVACSAATTREQIGFPSLPETPLSMVIGASGYPVISYSFGGNVSLILCNDLSCDPSISGMASPSPTLGNTPDASLGINDDDELVVAYNVDDFQNSLKVAHCPFPSGCGASWATTTVDPAGNVGRYNSLAIGSDGFPVVSYYDSGNGDLKVAHCGYVACDDFTPPSWPPGAVLTASEVMSDSVLLSWPQAVDDVGVTAYRLYGPFSDFDLLGTFDGATTSVRVTELTPATDYRFWVEPEDAHGNCQFSLLHCFRLDTSVTTNAPPPPLEAPTVGLVDISQGIWHLRNSAGGVTSFFYGNPGDLPISGDWDGDGISTPGLYRQSDGFFYARNSNDQGIADTKCFAGNPEDVPLSGDWDGDGDDNLGIYRPSEQVFYLFTISCTGSPMGAAQISFLFGNPGDKPVAGDWDGDGIDEVGLHRESTGFFYWRDTLTTGIASDEIFFGDPGDRFVAGDWGIVDGTDTPGIFRPSNLTFYFRHTLTQGIADSQFTWAGAGSGWLPVAGEFGLG